MKIIRVAELLTITSLSRPTIWRMERAGLFPARVQLGPNSVGWHEDEIIEWIEARPRVGTLNNEKIEK